MKILFLTNLYPHPQDASFGIFNFSRVKELVKQGNEVTVICPIGYTPEEKDIFPKFNIIKIIAKYRRKLSIHKHYLIDGVNIIYPRWAWLPRRFFWYYETTLLHYFAGNLIRNTIQKFKPDLIITSWMHPFGTYSKYIRKYYRGKIFSIAEGSDLLYMPFKYSGWSKIQKLINESNNRIFFVSESMKLEVQNKLSLKRGYVLPNGYDGSLFFSETVRKTLFSDKILLISIGNLNFIKGHDLLLKAMKVLDSRFFLSIIGDGSERPKYEKFVLDENLSERVFFHGKINHDEIYNYLANSDIFCMPSRSESFGIASLEALACGLPVVCSDVGGLRDLVVDDFNGYRFESENVVDLAKKIELCASKEWNSMALANWASDNYSLKTWIERLMRYASEK